MRTLSHKALKRSIIVALIIVINVFGGTFIISMSIAHQEKHQIMETYQLYTREAGNLGTFRAALVADGFDLVEQEHGICSNTYTYEKDVLFHTIAIVATDQYIPLLVTKLPMQSMVVVVVRPRLF